MTTRRNIMKMIGLAPAAATSAKGEIAAMLAKPGVQAMELIASTGLQDTDTAPGQPPGFSLLGQDGVTKLRRLIQKQDAEQGRFQWARVNGLEPDITVLKSVSHVNKYRIQRERDMEELEMMQRARDLVWW